MRLQAFTYFLFFLVIALVSFTAKDLNNLRNIYSQPSGNWPKPFVDPGVDWKELAELPEGPLKNKMDAMAPMIELGRILFFDPRISGSGKISCATCHQPELSWTDGRDRSLGHEGTINKRNSPSIQNVWFYNKLFWDGRSKDLEDQAFAPINSESEMHGDMRELPFKLRRIRGYAPLFTAAFGDSVIVPDRIATALANFQRTITSQRSRFDFFLAGDKKALSNNELNGLHLFRTKARCMNCHHGALFSDNKFHDNGFRSSSVENDKGLYNVTHQDADLRKFKTPILRDVLRTGPWLHGGAVKKVEELIDSYNNPAKLPSEPLLKPLRLTKKEKQDLIAFLGSISTTPPSFKRPVLPD